MPRIGTLRAWVFEAPVTPPSNTMASNAAQAAASASMDLGIYVSPAFTLDPASRKQNGLPDGRCGRGDIRVHRQCRLRVNRNIAWAVNVWLAIMNLRPGARSKNCRHANRPCPRSAGAKDSGSVVGTDAQTL